MIRENSLFTTKEGLVVEYSVTGQGEPILIMHGGHSNCNEEFGYRELIEQGYSMITPSRPGYGKTSKELGESIDSACEAYSDLLNYLKVSQVHVLAISAGGFSGIQFAAKYPQRVKGLILQSAVTDRWLNPNEKTYKLAKIMFRPSMEAALWSMIRAMNKVFPNFIFNSMAASFSTLSKKEILAQLNDDDKRAFGNMLNRQRSGYGFMIDLAQTSQNNKSELSAIECPVLIMHSSNDASVSVEHAYYAHQSIPHSQLMLLDSWGHLIWMGKNAGQMYFQLFEFLKSNR